MKQTICTVLGLIGGTVAGAFGGWSADLAALVSFMTVDYISGLLVAGVFRKSQKSQSGALESGAGFQGLCRKGMILLMVLIGGKPGPAAGAGLHPQRHLRGLRGQRAHQYY